jgi:hypothetical protein
MHENDKLQSPGRLEVVSKTRLLDSPADPEFDQLTRLASRLLRAPNALVTLVGGDRQFVKSNSVEGQLTPNPTGSSQSLDLSFCKHAVASREPFIVEDARNHPLVQDSDAVAAGVIAYAGVPLEVEGEAIGALCVIDSRPRSWSSNELDILRALARSGMRLIEEKMGVRGLNASLSGGQNRRLLETLSEHLRCLGAYEALLTSGDVDLKAEDLARQAVKHSFAQLVQAHGDYGSSSDPELGEAVSAYVASELRRIEATERFAAREIPLSELEALIVAQDDALAELRTKAVGLGGDV